MHCFATMFTAEKRRTVGLWGYKKSLFILAWFLLLNADTLIHTHDRCTDGQQFYSTNTRTHVERQSTVGATVSSSRRRWLRCGHRSESILWFELIEKYGNLLTATLAVTTVEYEKIFRRRGYPLPLHDFQSWGCANRLLQIHPPALPVYLVGELSVLATRTIVVTPYRLSTVGRRPFRLLSLVCNVNIIPCLTVSFKHQLWWSENGFVSADVFVLAL